MHKETHRRTVSRRRAAAATIGLVLFGVLATALLSGGAAAKSPGGGHQGLWQAAPASASQHAGQKDVHASHYRTFSVDGSGLGDVLDDAPGANAPKADSLVLALPAPDGTFQRFALEESALMAPGLAKKHPEIATYSGRGIDDPAATIHADLSPLGFHASVRSPQGAWYIDPYYHLDDSLYASYYGRDAIDVHGTFVERDADSAELSVDRGYYHADDTVTVNGSGFAESAAITITISDPEEGFAARTVAASSDESGSFSASFVADPDGNLETHIVTASDGDGSASTSYQVVRADDPTVDPPTGDVRRTYRLALITDPGYADYHGGPANVTAAKVALINRVSQVYEDDMSIALQLIAQTDLLNLNTWAAATAPNGPCGAAACFAQSNVTGCSSLARNRVVAGQIVGAESFDIGHLALGQPGGGVASLGVVGRANKSQGCTGIPTPIGDFYAIDYVAHEMGHQFSGNHPFNGNQLNCSGGNRNAATSVEVGSGSSIMAYAGICLTDDLSPHSDPYFSQRSLQEITTYTSSNQAAINEVQSAALRHFGGGNEVQVATFGPGFQPTAAIRPLTLTINAAPSATSRGGAEEVGTTVTIATTAANTLQVGDTVTVSGVPVAAYNGTWTVTAVPSTRSFQYENPVSGLATTGGGSVTLGQPGLTEAGTTVTVRTSANHNRSIGDQVTISGAGVAGYNQATPVTITAVPSPRTFEFTNTVAGLANSGGGTVTYTSPFRIRAGGNDSVLIGSGGLQYNVANLGTAINGIAGFAGTATVTGAASTGFTVTYGGASAGLDVPNLEFSGLACGGCFASFEETNHGGALDSFRLSYDGNVSPTLITNGTNYTAAGIQAALLPLLPAGATATVAGFGGGAFNNTGFQVTFGGTLALTNVPVRFGLQDFTAGASGWVSEFDKGGAVDNKGGIVSATGNSFPAVTAPAQFAIPLRTPFALTGNATDADGDTMTYSWEQNDRGGTAGSSLLFNTKTNGPLFAMFPKSATMSETDTLMYESPGENHLTTDPTRVFPDLQQILDGNTNAETGACPTGPIAPPVPIPVKECFAEFLPTADYVGFTGVNASPLSLHFRFTARDGRGGVNSADTTLLLVNTAGPFRVTSHASGGISAGSTQTVTWAVAGTDAAPISTTDVKISLSTDGGLTYPIVLASATPNDGSADVTIPQVAAAHARIKVEAVGNVFFDVSHGDLAIEDTTPPVLTVPGPIVVNATMPSGAVVTYSATATDNIDPNPTVVCTPPSGSVFPIGTTTVSCTATDASGNSSSASFTVHVKGAAEQLADLKVAVTGLPPGTSLKDKVTSVLASLAAGKKADACGTLGAFMNEVTAQTGKKLTAAQAASLLADAARIRNVLAC